MPNLTGYTTTPGSPISVAVTSLPAGLTMGFQVLKAANGTVAVGRSTNVLELTPGNYTATFISPAQPDLYLVIFDWNDGVLTAAESATSQLVVQGVAAVEQTGFGSIADYARLSIGGETWKGLIDSPTFGPDLIKLAVETIKARVIQGEVDETSIPKPALSYLGKLVALELLPAARSWWANQVISHSIGDDPAEMESFPDRTRMIDALEDALYRQVRAEQDLAISIMPSPILRSDVGPDIDEDDDSHYVTSDPRDFPALGEYPDHDHLLRNRARTWWPAAW